MRVVSDKDFCRQKDLRKWHNTSQLHSCVSPKAPGDVIDRGQDLIPDRRHRSGLFAQRSAIFGQTCDSLADDFIAGRIAEAKIPFGTKCGPMHGSDLLLL